MARIDHFDSLTKNDQNVIDLSSSLAPVGMKMATVVVMDRFAEMSPALCVIASIVSDVGVHCSTFASCQMEVSMPH